MSKIPLIALCTVLLCTLSAQELRVVNAASLTEAGVAPGSIVSVFGTKLTNGVETASDVQKPPAALNGVTVSVGGAAAALIYVSPTQINAVLSPATPAGVQTVTVASGGKTQTGSVTVAADAPPGLFSLFGTGTRDGAILNAVDFRLGDFSTRTANSPTYLALFATGLNTSSTPVVNIGGVPVEVVFYGAAPCCAGLQQINVKLTDSLAGAGRVPVVLTSNGKSSNAVQVVLLPPAESRQFEDDQENETRSRNLATLAYIPNTSLVLSADQNDDVVRVIDIAARKVTAVIALSAGAEPVGMAVTADGKTALVAEAGLGKVAVIDLTAHAVSRDIATGLGPVSVAIGGTKAVVVNGDADTVSVIDLGAGTVQKTITVGRGPVAVAVDAAGATAYVVNENDGTVSVVNLASLAVTATLPLGDSVRAEHIALIPGTPIAFLTAPAAGPHGEAILLNLSTGKTTSIAANPDRSGGSSDVAFYNSKLYFANQTGASISVLPINAQTGEAAGPIATVKVDLGPRALAIDTKDGLLAVSNEGTGTIVLVDLASNTVIGRINGVRTGSDDDDGEDDHSDRNGAANLPSVASIAPVIAKAGASFTLTINGAKLTNATAVVFVDPADLPGKGNGRGKGASGGKSNGPFGASDAAFTVTNIQVNTAGTQLTATVSMAPSAKTGRRVVRVATPNGESTYVASAGNTFTVAP